MKPLKVVALLLGTGALLTVATVGVALIPAFQTWAAHRALAGSPLAVERVAFGLSGARLEGITLRQPGWLVRAGTLETHYRPAAWLWQQRMEIEVFQLREVVVERVPIPPLAPAGASASIVAAARADVRPTTSPRPTPAQPEAFAGLLEPGRLPLDLRLGQFLLEGRAMLAPGQTATFKVTASNLGTGTEGKLEWSADYADTTPDVALRGLRSTGTATLAIGADRVPRTAGVEALLAVLGPALPSDQVTFGVQTTRDDRGQESYTARLGLIRRGQAETLLQAQAAFVPPQAAFTGTWEVTLRSEQLAALLAGFGLPEVAATGKGTFSVRPDGTAGSTTGRLQAVVSRLHQISPTLAGIGAIQVAAGFDLGLEDSAAQLKAFDVDVSEAGGRRFARLQLTQAATYRLTDRKLTLANAQAEAARLTLDAVPLAWAQPLLPSLQVGGGTLSLQLSAMGEPDGSRIRLEGAAPLHLQAVTVRDASGKALVEGLTLSVRPKVDYAQDRVRAEFSELRLSLPGGDSVAGVLRAEGGPLSARPVTTFEAQLDAQVASLLRPFLAFDPGALKAKLSLSGRHEGHVLDVTQAAVRVNRAGGALLAAATVLQPVQSDLRASRWTARDVTAPAARLELGEIPLAWAGAYLPASQFSGTLSGATLTVAWAADGAAILNTTAPLTLRGAGVTLEQKPQVNNLDLILDATATRRESGVSFAVRKLEARQGEESLLQLDAEGELTPGPKPAGKIKGTLQAEALLFRQPALAALLPLAQGRIRTTFDTTFKVGDALAAKLTLTTRGLGLRGAPALGDADLALTGSAKADGSATFSLPLSVTTAGRKSDLALEGSVSAAAPNRPRTFALRATSANLVADDLQAFAALAPATPPASAATPATSPAPARAGAAGSGRPPNARPTPAAAIPDRSPPWKGLQGRVELDLKRVLYGRDYTGRGIRGTVTLTESRLALDNLQGSFRDQPFGLSGALTFTPAQTQPYALTGQVDIAGIAVGELLRAANPSEKPLLESTVKVAAKVTGRGVTVPDTLTRSFGQFEVTGGPGILRALGQKSQSVGAASALLGLAGALTGSGNTLALGQLGRELEEMKFDRFSVKVERDAALNFRTTAIEFLSPTKRLTGRGTMTYREGVPYDDWPFELEFRLAGKDYMARLLNEARALSGQEDERGYYPMAVPFTVNGTVSRVNTSLWKVLAGTAARAGLEGLLVR